MYATTREFLERFGLNDLSDLPKVDEMADALGFELPTMVGEPAEKPSPLPFEQAEAASSADATEARGQEQERTADEPVH